MSDLDDLKRLAGIAGPASASLSDVHVLVERDGTIKYNGAEIGKAKLEKQMGHEVVTFDTTQNYAAVRRAVSNLPAIVNEAIYKWAQDIKETNEHNDSGRRNLLS